MKRTTLAMLAAATGLASALAPAQAGDEVPGPSGAACGFWSASATTPGQQDGVLHGGPIVGDGTLTCTIQVGGRTHADADTLSRSASNSAVVVLNPTAISYPAPAGSPVYLCTQWTPANGGPVLYQHASDNGTEGDTSDDVDTHWSDDASSPCSQTVAEGTDGDEGDALDPLLCPLFPVVLDGTVAGTVTVEPDGDVFVAGSRVWDCPPYRD